MADQNISASERLVESGLRLYDRFSDRKAMPTNRRIFLESVLDKSKEPITETSFSPAELNILGEIIRNKYTKIEPALAEYEKYLTGAMEKHNRAVLTKDKDRIMYPEFAKRYSQDLAAINAYRQGKLTPEFLNIAAGVQDYPRDVALRNVPLRNTFSVKPVIGYEDYGIDDDKARQATAGADPRAALHTTLGRFRYEVDPVTGSLVVVDRYDFNPPVSVFTGVTKTSPRIGAEQLVMSPEGFEGGMYGLLRQYAGRVLPEGSGRDVKIRLNNLAPVPKNSLAN
jgi:hypothetical protein